MQCRTDPVQTPDRQHGQSRTDGKERQPYAAPQLEHLGNWTALTLEQSVGIAFIRAILAEELLWWPE